MDKKKSLLLTILAIVTLVSVTIGTTYAFFYYSKTGTTNNVITTGTVNFLYAYDSTNNGINITNAMPTATLTGQGLTGENNTFVFTISGQTPQNANIPYTMYARAGDTQSDKTRFLDSEIGIYLSASNTLAGNHEASLTSFSSNLTTINDLPNATTNGGNLTNTTDRSATTNRKVLGTGTLYGLGTAANTVTYTLRMWVADTVTLSDDDANASYQSSESGVGTRYVYGNMYYSLKVDVEANV